MVETFVQSTDDVVKFLKDQHNLIKDMFDEVLSASESKAREKAFVDLRQLLAVHETAEEMVVHPRVRDEEADGEGMVEARLDEEHEAKETLSELEGMDIDTKEFIEELRLFRDKVSAHAEAGGSRSSTAWSANSTGGAQAAGHRGARRGGHRAHPAACQAWSRPTSISLPGHSSRCSTGPVMPSAATNRIAATESVLRRSKIARHIGSAGDFVFALSVFRRAHFRVDIMWPKQFRRELRPGVTLGGRKQRGRHTGVESEVTG